MVSSFVAARAVTVLGRPIARFPDTAGYFRIDLAGGATRLWPVPVVYALAANDTTRVVVQLVASCVAWVWLAHEVRRHAPTLPTVAPLLVLTLGATPQVARWDLTILSESLGITIAVATFAALLRAVRLSDRWWVVVAIVAIVFGTTRTAQVPILVVVTVMVSVAAWRTARRPVALTVVAISVLGSAWGLAQLRNNHAVGTLNLYTVVAERVLPHPDVAEWFAAAGMPWRDDFAAATSYVGRADVAADVLDAVGLPVEQLPPAMMGVGGIEFAEWARHDGWAVYARYLASHPTSTFVEAAARADELLDPVDAALLPLGIRRVVPRQLFGRSADWLGVLLFATCLAWRAGVADRRSLVPLLTVAVALPWYLIALFGSGIEHPRHAITVAVMVRVAALTGALVAWDQLRPRPAYQVSQWRTVSRGWRLASLKSVPVV